MGAGRELLAPHIDPQRVTKFFGERHDIDQFGLLGQIAGVRVPADVGPGGNIERELAYGDYTGWFRLNAQNCVPD